MSSKHRVHNIGTTLRSQCRHNIALTLARHRGMLSQYCVVQHPHNVVSTLLRRPGVVGMSMSPERCQHNVVATLLRRRHDIGIQRRHNVEKSSHKNIVPTLKINVVTIFN